MTAMTTLEGSTSTYAKPGASRTTNCKDVATLDDPNVYAFDFLDHQYIKSVSSLKSISAVKWRKGASIASLSQDFYGTTSYWSLILMFNGFISSSHIPNGAVVNIPDVSPLKAKLLESNKGKITGI